MDENEFRTEWRLARERDGETDFAETLRLLERAEAAQHHSLALAIALEAGLLPVVSHLLVWEETQVDFASDLVYEGLDNAAYAGNRDCVRAVLEDGRVAPRGDDVDHAYVRGILNSAMLSGNIELVRDLLDNNEAWFNSRDGDHLYCAAESKHPAIVRECLDRRLYDMHRWDRWDEDPWHDAITRAAEIKPTSNEILEILEMLLAVEELAPHAESRDPLAWALKHDYAEVVAAYLQQLAPGMRDDDTPIWDKVARILRGGQDP